MEHYTIARVTGDSGEKMFAKYIVYGQASSFQLGSTVQEVMRYYKHAAQNQCVTLSTVPTQQFFSFFRQSDLKTLALEVLLDSEKQEVADFLLKAEK